MNIDENQVKTKRFAGHTKDGSPIVYIETVGGLHTFFKKEDGKIESISAAPHKGIAQWIAEKQSPGIKWDSDFLTKSEEEMAKSETNLANRLINHFFYETEKVSDLNKSDAECDTYVIYEPYHKSIEFLTKDEIPSVEKPENYLIRDIKKLGEIKLLKDHPLCKKEKQK